MSNNRRPSFFSNFFTALDAAISPGDFEDITDMLVPELVRRGRYKEAYRQGTLREKLFGAGRARLAAPHPATQYRHHQAAKAAE